jgi:hypothetical protein
MGFQLNLLIAAGLFWVYLPYVGPRAAQNELIKEIEALGGKVILDVDTPGQPPLVILFFGSKFTDRNVKKYIPVFPTLQQLVFVNTKVSYKGLGALPGLFNLRSLSLHIRDGRQELTEKELKLFGQIDGLRHLTIIGYKLPPNAVRQLEKRKPKLLTIIDAR